VINKSYIQTTPQGGLHRRETLNTQLRSIGKGRSTTALASSRTLGADGRTIADASTQSSGAGRHFQADHLTPQKKMISEAISNFACAAECAS